MIVMPEFGLGSISIPNWQFVPLVITSFLWSYGVLKESWRWWQRERRRSAKRKAAER